MHLREDHALRCAEGRAAKQNSHSSATFDNIARLARTDETDKQLFRVGGEKQLSDSHYTCFFRTDQMNPSYQKCMMAITIMKL